MTPDRRSELTLLRRARDLMDRRFAEPLDVPAIAAAVHLSPAHFSRRFRETYGETPHAYLTTRRIERACALLRAGVPVTEACALVGCASLGSFSTRFREITGLTPSGYRTMAHEAEQALPGCVARIATRPVRRSSRNGEAAAAVLLLPSGA